MSNSEIEVIFKHLVDGKHEDFYYDDPVEALYDIAIKLRDGYEIVFISMVARVSFDYEKGEIY